MGYPRCPIGRIRDLLVKEKAARKAGGGQRCLRETKKNREK
jgi:hypothetical protein